MGRTALTYEMLLKNKQTFCRREKRERFVMGHKLGLLRLSEVKVENNLITVGKDLKGFGI